MKKLNQQGSAVFILVLILVLAVAGGVGYYVYNNQKTKKPQSGTSTGTNKSDKTIGSQSIEIKEMGIRINLGKYAADAYYQYKDGVATLASRKLKADFPDCTIEQLYTGKIFTTTEPDKIIEPPAGGQQAPFKEIFPYGTQIGGTYYYGVNPQMNGCTSLSKLSDSEYAKLNDYTSAAVTDNFLKATQSLEKL